MKKGLILFERACLDLLKKREDFEKEYVCDWISFRQINETDNFKYVRFYASLEKICLQNINIAFIYKMSDWMNIVKKTAAKNKGMPLREVLKLAKAEYKLLKEGVVGTAKVLGKTVVKQGKLIKKTGKRISRKVRKSLRGGGDFPSSEPEQVGGKRRTRRSRKH